LTGINDQHQPYRAGFAQCVRVYLYIKVFEQFPRHANRFLWGTDVRLEPGRTSSYAFQNTGIATATLNSLWTPKLSCELEPDVSELIDLKLP